MRTNYIKTLALLPILLLPACDKDENVDNMAIESVASMDVLTATFAGDEDGNQLRTTLQENDGSYKNIWLRGDEFVLTDGNVVATYSNAEQDNLSVFDRTSDQQPSLQGPYLLYYPASGYRSFADDLSSFRVEIPRYQEYDESLTLANGSYPMICRAKNNKNFSFYNLGCMIRLNVSAPTGEAMVKFITITAENAHLSGMATASISEDNVPSLKLDELGDDRPKSVTLVCNEGVPVGTADKMFYMALPYGTYQNLRFEVETVNGSRYSSTISKVTFSRSKFRSLNNFKVRILSVGELGIEGEFAD